MHNNDGGSNNVQYRNISIGLMIVFICEIIQLVSYYIIVPFIENDSAMLIYVIIFEAALAVEVAGMFIAARGEKSFRGAAIANITFFVVYLIFAIIDMTLRAEGLSILRNNFVIILCDATATIFAIRALINFYEAKNRPVRFLRITNIIVIVSAMIGIFACLWESTVRAMGAVTMLIFLVVYVASVICSFVFYLIPMGKAIRDCAKERL